MRWIVVASIVACVCSTAHAEDRDKAVAAYRAGTKHYDLAEYKEALESFKEAYRQHEDPTFLFNIAQCHRQLGDKQQSIRFYRTYLIKVPDSPKRDQIREMVAKLEAQVAEEQSARKDPPQGMLKPAETAPPSEPKPESAPPPETSAPSLALEPKNDATTPKPTPIYKKWWLWTAVGAVVVVGVGVGLGVGLSQSSESTPMVMTDFGTIRF